MAIVFGLAGCSGDGWQVRRVTAVQGGVSMEIASCNATYDIDVEEGTEEIVISVEQLTPTDPPGSECLDSQSVPLSDPVGDRDVIVNGEQFEVSDTTD